MKRVPAVAGQFYPADPILLKQTIADLSSPRPTSTKEAIAIVSPHAGFIYSGSVAAETINSVHIPDDVIVLGPNHHGLGAKLAVSIADSWQNPLGDVPINKQIVSELCDGVPFSQDDTAHSREHSLEVQLPFLQLQNSHISLTAICVSHVSYEECCIAGEKLATVIKNQAQKPLIVASTDMSHYESRESASIKDEMALQCVQNMDPEKLYQTVISNRISMCGVLPTTITLIAAKSLGATQVDLVRYTDSGEVSGDTNQVVGYAGLVIS